MTNISPEQFTLIQLWFAGICTLAIYSLLYKENPVYRVFEYMFLGLGSAYGFSFLYKDVMIPKLWDPLTQGQWWWFIPFLFGLLYFTVYSGRFSWMARTLIGTLMGLAAGYQFTQVVNQYFPQIRDSFRPLTPGAVEAVRAANNVVTAQPAWHEAANNVVFFITLIAVMTYFFFSFEHRNKTVVKTAQLGRWLLMISFGTMFGSTITARAALAISRIIFIVYDWIGHYTGWKM